MNKAVFLDRDGVINKAIIKDGEAYSPRYFSEFEFAENVDKHINRLKDAGYLIIVVTNQPSIVRGSMNISELDRMTRSIQSYLAVDEILICIHDDIDNCTCRKPKPGMLFDAAWRHKIGLNKSFLVGDGWRDMEAAINAGCKGILIDTCYNKAVDCSRRVKDLAEAVDMILNGKVIS